MSKIGKLPITIPSGVQVTLDGRDVSVVGPRGTLSLRVRPECRIKMEDSQIIVERVNNTKMARAMHGLNRTLIDNIIKGVSDGWDKTLEINGVGYRASLQGVNLSLSLGFSHPVLLTPPPGISFEVTENKVTVTGADKVLVGEIAAKIRKLRPPEPYKGKGIRYLGEYVRRKAGKAAKTQA